MSSTSRSPHSSTSVTVKVLSGPHQGEQFTIAKESFNIGRGPDNDLILINDPKLSRSHINISLNQSKLKIVNLSARNPIFYKNNFEKEILLQKDESIRIGDTELQFSWLTDQTEVFPDMPTRIETTATEERTSMSQLPLYNDPKLNLYNASEKQALNPLLKTTATNSPSAPNAISNKPIVTHPTVSYPQTNYNSQRNDSKKNNTRSFSQNRSYSYNEKPIIYIVGGIVLLLFIIILSSGGEKKIKKPTLLKDTAQLSSELLQNAEYAQQHSKEKHLLEDGRMDRIFESAQSFYIKGFRDYRNGQFNRAITAFQAALSFDPNHVLARKYLHQSIKKQDELMQFNLDQAKRYRDKNNFRLCRASAQNVMVMSPQKGSTEPRYLDAKKIFDECDTLSKGRF